jgi:anaerobic magnesium-protoporphyrin IX monomethyl ester cyclase
MNRSILMISLQDNLDVIGLRSLHYQLLQHGYDSYLLFVPGLANTAMSSRACTSVYSLVDVLSPLFIGISLMSGEYQRAVRMTRALKNYCASIPIVWGGIHPTIAPETCLDYADFVCIGEGERFIVDFANAVANGTSPEALGSLSFRRNGQVIQNSLYPLVTDLATLPSCEHLPRNSYVLHKEAITALNIRTFRKYARYSGTTYSIMSSRGCPFSCTYCCNNALATIYGSKRIRLRETSGVINELKEAITHYPFIEYINFQDDCFLARTDEEMERFCHLYEAEVERPFIARSIPTFITERKIALLKSAGLAWISLGLQSGSDRVCRDVYKRRSGKRDFLRAARAIKKQDLAAFYDVILDNPFETDEDRLESVLTLMETPKPFYTQFFSLTLYPGTELRKRALEEGLIKGEEYQSKDYLLYQKTSVNNLVRLATFIPSRWMEFLLGLYRRKPTSLWFRSNVTLARLFAIAFFEPLTYLKVIWLSQRKKLGATLRVLPHYVKEGLRRFRKQFGW